jgi:hypothetical protein
LKSLAQIFDSCLLILVCQGAPNLVQTARRKYPGLKVALLREAGDPADIGADAVISKPANVDSPNMVSAWEEKIMRLISEYLTA